MSKKVVIFNNQFSDSIVSEANLNAYEKANTYKTDQFMDAYDYEEEGNYNYAEPIQPNTA